MRRGSPSARSRTRRRRRRPLPSDGTLRILVAHGPIDFRGEAHEPYTLRQSVLEDAVTSGRVGYVALGDRHSTTPIGDTGRIWYAGSPEPTAHDETDAGNVLAGRPRWRARARSSADRRHLAVRVETLELTAGPGPTTLQTRLDALPDKDRTVVRLTLQGVVSLTDHARVSHGSSSRHGRSSGPSRRGRPTASSTSARRRRLRRPGPEWLRERRGRTTAGHGRGHRRQRRHGTRRALAAGPARPWPGSGRVEDPGRHPAGLPGHHRPERRVRAIGGDRRRGPQRGGQVEPPRGHRPRPRRPRLERAAGAPGRPTRSTGTSGPRSRSRSRRVPTRSRCASASCASPSPSSRSTGRARSTSADALPMTACSRCWTRPSTRRCGRRSASSRATSWARP